MCEFVCDLIKYLDEKTINQSLDKNFVSPQCEFVCALIKYIYGKTIYHSLDKNAVSPQCELVCLQTKCDNFEDDLPHKS